MAPEIENDAADAAGTAETRVYEFGFHLDAELGQEEVKKQYGEMKDRIASAGEIVAEGEPTKIPLAYTISRQETTGRRDFDTSYFCWIAYEMDGPAHDEFIEYTKGLASIIRAIDIRTDREAAQHAAEMHELFIRNAAEAAAEFREEESSDTPEAQSQAVAEGDTQDAPRKDAEV